MKKYLIAGILAGLMGLLINIGSIHIDFKHGISKNAVYLQENINTSPAMLSRESGVTEPDSSSVPFAETLFLVWFGVMAVFGSGKKDTLTPVPVRVRIK